MINQRFHLPILHLRSILISTILSLTVCYSYAADLCEDAVPLSDGYSHEVQFTNETLNYSWYSFVATEPDFHITINQINGDNPVGASFGRFTISVYGPYSQCEIPCENLAPIFSQTLSHTDLDWGFHQYIESFEINSGDLTPIPDWYPAQYLIRIESSFGNMINSNMLWEFDMVGTSCCWPEQESEPSPYAYCDNFFNLTPGLNQTISLPVSTPGINEFWFATTSPAGIGLPDGSLQLGFDPNLSEDPCSFLLADPASYSPAIQIEQFGPYDGCSEPCEQFNLFPSPFFTLDSPEYTGGGFEVGTLTIPSGEVEQLWLYRMTFEVTCAPCEFVLKYNLSGAIPGFTDPDDLQAPCTNCLPVQGLLPDKKYIVTAWVKDADIDPFESTIIDAEIRIMFDGGSILGNASLPSGPIVDGWQQIECEFLTPSSFYDFNIELNSLDGVVYFDDVRMFPYDGSMKCFVYDPQSLRFVAELDERHFATFYEYDEEGRLMRIKKETERGVMTIQESKTSTVKRDNVPE